MIDAKYTIVLKTLMDDENVKPLLDKAMSTYPMYERENLVKYGLIPTRDELNTKILNHYKYREIGFETVGRFLDELEITMNEIMPYYYQMYKSVDVMNGIDDIFGNVDITETFEQETKGSSKDVATGNIKSNSDTTTNSNATSESTTNSNVSSNGRSVKADTPQSQLKVKDINSITSATEINWNEDNSNSNATSNGSDTTEATSKNTAIQDSTSNLDKESSGLTKHTLTKVGNQGVNTYAHDMLEFRELFVNIEQKIINDKRLSELFMLVY